MKLFVGLGNPGSKYETTRHNIGRILLDQLCTAEGFTEFLYNKKFDGDVATGMLGKWQIIALKPQTFMNKSGKSVQAAVNYYNIDPNDILVFQDDIDLAFGKMKLKFAGSHGGHNGIRDTEKFLGTDKFRRLKFGIGRPDHPEHEVADYVLSKFTTQELKRREKQEMDIRGRVESYLKNTG